MYVVQLKLRLGRRFFYQMQSWVLRIYVCTPYLPIISRVYQCWLSLFNDIFSVNRYWVSRNAYLLDSRMNYCRTMIELRRTVDECKSSINFLIAIRQWKNNNRFQSTMIDRRPKNEEKRLVLKDDCRRMTDRASTVTDAAITCNQTNKLDRCFIRIPSCLILISDKSSHIVGNMVNLPSGYSRW